MLNNNSIELHSCQSLDLLKYQSVTFTDADFLVVTFIM